MARRRSLAQKESIRLASEAGRKKRIMKKMQRELGAKFHPEIHDPVLKESKLFLSKVAINR